MKLKDIKDVLTYASFRPEPDDGTAGWVRRFPKAKTLLLNVNKSGASWIGLEKGSEFTEPGAADGTLKEVATQAGEEWKALADDGWCAVSLSTRYVISLEANLSRKKGSEDQIRSNPKAALGAKAERGKRYAVRHNPQSNTSVLLAVEEDGVTKIETVLKEFGMGAGRIACGTFAQLSELIDQVAEARRVQAEKNPDVGLGSVVMVTCCQGSVCALTQEEDSWTELRSRTDLYDGDDMEPVVGIVLPLIENAGAGCHVVFMSDQPGSTFPGLLQQKMPSARISDVTVDNQLWKLLADL
ncbi:hypothetical protein BH23VER1_BH23VER1_06280 [soil metagenome]